MLYGENKVTSRFAETEASHKNAEESSHRKGRKGLTNRRQEILDKAKDVLPARLSCCKLEDISDPKWAVQIYSSFKTNYGQNLGHSGRIMPLCTRQG